MHKHKAHPSLSALVPQRHATLKIACQFPKPSCKLLVAFNGETVALAHGEIASSLNKVLYVGVLARNTMEFGAVRQESAT